MPSDKHVSLFSDFIPFAVVILQGGDAERLLLVFKNRTKLSVCLHFKNRMIISTDSSVFEEQMRTYPYKELLRIFYHVSCNDECEVIFDLPVNCVISKVVEDEIKYLCLSLQLLITIKRSQQLIEYHYREHFVQDLLFSRIHSEEELHNRSSLYNWNLSGRVAVLIATFTKQIEPESNKFVSLLKGRMKLLYPDMIFSDGNNKVIFLIPLLPDRQIKKDLQLVVQAFHTNLRTNVYLSLSGEHASFLQAGRAYQEAIQALSIAKTFLKKRHLIFWEELGAYKLLSDIVQNKYTKCFIQETLGKLIEADEHYHGDLMKTLSALECCNWNFSATAKKLHIHYNTLKYRYKKLERLLHLDENNNESRFSIILALHLYRLEQPDGT